MVLRTAGAANRGKIMPSGQEESNSPTGATRARQPSPLPCGRDEDMRFATAEGAGAGTGEGNAAIVPDMKSMDEIKVLEPGCYEKWAAPKVMMPSSARGKRWDLVMVVCLIFCALVTPYEVAFLKTSLNPLFVVNRIIDLLFVLDMVKSFFTAYRDEEKGKWVRDPIRIARNYLRGWFAIDLASILPFDTVGLALDDPALNDAKVIRLIRLLRLLKLMRIFRAMRMLKRWEDHISISYAVIALSRFLVLVLVVIHWSACMLRLTPSIEMATRADGQPISWLTELEVDGSAVELESDGSRGTQYTAALYWAMMTLTTIGYGDISLVTDGERILGMVCMFVGGGIYAYIVGAVCGILATMDEQTTAFHQTMDQLNRYSQSANLPRALRVRLRAYFRQTRELAENHAAKALLHRMSPTLRKEVALFINAATVRRVHFFKVQDDQEYYGFVTQLTLIMVPAVYAPQEVVVPEGQRLTEMFLIRSGIAAVGGGRIRSAGDFFLTEGVLLDCTAHHKVLAVSFLHVFRVARADVDGILLAGGYPQVERSIRRERVRVCFRRNILALLVHMRDAHESADEVRARIDSREDKDRDRAARKDKLRAQGETFIGGSGRTGLLFAIERVQSKRRRAAGLPDERKRRASLVAMAQEESMLAGGRKTSAGAEPALAAAAAAQHTMAAMHRHDFSALLKDTVSEALVRTMGKHGERLDRMEAILDRLLRKEHGGGSGGSGGGGVAGDGGDDDDNTASI
eukprot:g5892.t1